MVQPLCFVHEYISKTLQRISCTQNDTTHLWSNLFVSFTNTSLESFIASVVVKMVVPICSSTHSFRSRIEQLNSSGNQLYPKWLNPFVVQQIRFVDEYISWTLRHISWIQYGSTHLRSNPFVYGLHVDFERFWGSYEEVIDVEKWRGRKDVEHGNRLRFITIG